MKKIKYFIFSLYLNNIILFIINCYFVFIYINSFKIKNFEFNPNVFYTIIISIIIVWFIIFIVLLLLNIINAFKLFYKKDLIVLKKSVKLVKISTIPFYILNFIFLILLIIFFIIPTRGFVFFLIPSLFLSTYCILLLTSLYSIFYILLLWKYDKINNTEFLIIFILQFCFILDIFSILYLLKKKGLIEIDKA